MVMKVRNGDDSTAEKAQMELAEISAAKDAVMVALEDVVEEANSVSGAEYDAMMRFSQRDTGDKRAKLSMRYGRTGMLNRIATCRRTRIGCVTRLAGHMPSGVTTWFVGARLARGSR